MMKEQFLEISGLREVKTEVLRKSIHFLIAFSPGMALISLSATIGILGAGIVLYSIFEVLRISGIKVPLVSALTAAASRPRDEGHFVLGPVTLGLGAMLALLYFPPVSAAIAVYALAFGDSTASLMGKLFGRNRPAFLYGKSIEGSLACFITVYFVALHITGNFNVSLIAAITASMAEALPLEDFDNLFLPLVVGLALTACGIG